MESERSYSPSIDRTNLGNFQTKPTPPHRIFSSYYLIYIDTVWKQGPFALNVGFSWWKLAQMM